MTQHGNKLCSCLNPAEIRSLIIITCGLVVVTLDVDKSITVPPGDVCGPFICVCAVVTHFTDKLIAEKPTGRGGPPPPVLFGSYWYIGLKIRILLNNLLNQDTIQAGW